LEPYRLGKASLTGDSITIILRDRLSKKNWETQLSRKKRKRGLDSDEGSLEERWRN